MYDSLLRETLVVCSLLASMFLVGETAAVVNDENTLQVSGEDASVLSATADQ